MPYVGPVRSLTVRNLLSFGDQPTTIELQNLNVLIGPNGSGKSNLIEVLGLLQNAPKELATAISNGGPIEEWLWKGSPLGPIALAKRAPIASIEAIVSPATDAMALRYRLAFTSAVSRFLITDECIENEHATADQERPYFYFAHINGRPVLSHKGEERELNPVGIISQRSILSQLRDPEHYPEITYIGYLFARFRFYRDWEFGSLAAVREPCDASLPNEYLEEDGSNLGVVLDRLLALPPVKRELLSYLQTFYEDAADLRTSNQFGKVQTGLEEKHLTATIPLARLSDGTIRWLELLTILLNPDPPPLVCIEEPELGLHPDMVHELGKLLLLAATRMQLIITTHSDTLIEEFTETPDVVVVCEKEKGASTFRRLDAERLKAWLEEYSLGVLWTKGQLGGTRW